MSVAAVSEDYLPVTGSGTMPAGRVSAPMNPTSESSNETRTFQEGALVIVSIGKKSWSTQQTPEMYGLEKWPANYKPGRVLLLPEASLQKIDYLEGQARRSVDKFAFDFGLQDARAKQRWVHISKLGLVLVTLDQIKENFFQAVHELAEGYQALKASMQAQVEADWVMMKDSLNQPHLPNPWPKIEAQYIDANSIRQHYYFSFQAINMTFPSGMSAVKRYEVQQADLAILDRERAEKMTAQELARLQAEHRARLERVLKEQQEIAISQTQQFVDGVVGQLRGKIVETFTNIMDKVRDGKPLIAVNLTRIRETLNEVRQLDFIGSDQAFHEQLNRVEALLNSGKSFKTDAAAAEELNQVLSGTVQFIADTNAAALAEANKTYFSRKLVY